MTLETTLINNYATLLKKLLFSGEKENIVSSLMENGDEFNDIFEELILPLWIEKTTDLPKIMQFNLSQEQLDLGFPFIKRLLNGI